MDNKLAQELLIKQRILDPPADGLWGRQSAAALGDFQSRNGLPNGGLNEKTKAALEKAPIPQFKLGSDFASKIVKYMLAKNYWVPVGARRYSIVYVEGINPNGTLNDDNPNEWNDTRLVIEVLEGIPMILGSWVATSEPGDHYTYFPMNSDGAFRIKFGQYKAWSVGVHGNSEPHDALVQVASIEGFRDFNQDFVRTGDKITAGIIGANQHYGYDMSKVGVASAGCLVGRFRQGHREFMKIIKGDIRYQLNNNYVFFTAVLPGNEL